MTPAGARLLDDRGVLDRAAGGRLRARIEAGSRRARRTGAPALVSISSELEADADPAAIVYASRAGDEPWFCFEQPDRERIALATLGAVRTLEAAGPNRFDELAQRWRALADAAIADTPGADEAPGAGLTAVGGFAFAPGGAADPAWRGFASASLLVPALSLARRGRRTWLTVNVEVAPDDDPARLIAAVEHRLAALRDAPLPLLDPAPIGRYEVVSAMPPAHYEQAVQRAVQRIREGELEKVVLAREVEVHAPAPHDPGAVLGMLREASAARSSTRSGAATPPSSVRRRSCCCAVQGQRATTVALAGSTRRSADPAVDDHLGEQLLR